VAFRRDNPRNIGNTTVKNARENDWNTRRVNYGELKPNTKKTKRDKEKGKREKERQTVLPGWSITGRGREKHSSGRVPGSGL